MAIFSTRTDYALVLLVGLARKKDFTSLRVVSKEYHLPYRYISRLAVHLKTRGLLKSREGIQGGYLLAKNPKLIKVMDVVEVFEGEFACTRCTKKSGYCPNEKNCCMRGNWIKMQNSLANTLKHYSIADFK
jgi:Rrf2 family protein